MRHPDNRNQSNARPGPGLLIAIFALLSLVTFNAAHAVDADSKTESAQSEKQKMLQRIYQTRMQLERERIQRDNEGRAYARVYSNDAHVRQDAPSVTQMRRDMSTKLTRIEQNLRCLDVDVDHNSGNTVVICGDNNGDIHGENTTAGRDIITRRPTPQVPSRQ